MSKITKRNGTTRMEKNGYDYYVPKEKSFSLNPFDINRVTKALGYILEYQALSLQGSGDYEDYIDLHETFQIMGMLNNAETCTVCRHRVKGDCKEHGIKVLASTPACTEQDSDEIPF